MRAPCPILILAAGGSTRMGGRDKLLETVDGHPLIRTQTLRALATGQPVFVTVPALDHPRTQAIADLNVRLIAIPNAAEGLSTSLRTGVKALPKADAFMVTLADLVAIHTQDMNALLNARGEHPYARVWRAATLDKKPGHPVIFDSSLRQEFDVLMGDQGAGPIIAAHSDNVHLVPIGDNALLDLDTPEDWAEWRSNL
jgi:CTP:molybdopterin cytidylyltransferase MocA